MKLHRSIITFGNRWLLGAGFIFFVTSTEAYSQTKTQMVRIAKIVVDSTQLTQYKAALAEEINESIRLEPGVLTLYAVSEIKRPHYITILEIYADSAAYKTHIQTPHFLKYKTGTKDMVKGLELLDTVPLIPHMKIK